jgi:hypothetical protein
VKVTLAWMNPYPKIVLEESSLEAMEGLWLMRHLQLNLTKERSFTRSYVSVLTFLPSIETYGIVAFIPW